MKGDSMRQSIVILLFVLAGCGTRVVKNPDPIEISGKVQLAGGRPVTAVVFNLQPTAGGSQAVIPLKNGEFKATVTPGRYTYYITEGSAKDPQAKESYSAIPAKFREGAMDRQIEIAAGATTVDIKLE
jgi:hypothetical protein